MSTYRTRKARLLVTVFLATLGLVSVAASGVTQELGAVPGSTSDLPVTGVSLFTSGVGYFQHDGTVNGDVDVDLVVAAGDVNDLLKSLVLQDFDGGIVQVVTYPSQDPLSRILGSFSINIADNPALAELINRGRGEVVSVRFAVAGSDGGRAQEARGTVSGVEYRTVATDRGSEQQAFLNLITSSGLSQISFAQIETIQFASATLQAELEAALEVIADNRQQNQKTITIRFRGEGQRRVRVGYVRAVPVWKTSYRLVLGDGDEAQIQGWAIAENTSENDWTEVSLGLVSGQPISFVIDLYTPIYRNRPRVSTDTGVAVAPQTYDRASEAISERSFARASEAPSAAMSFADELMDFSAEPEPIDLSQGVQAAASMESGAVYRINEPVSIPRRGAALIPIVATTIPAERVAIYDHTVLSNRPLSAVRLTNETGLQLPAGPATIFDGATYAGDAQLPEVIADEERLLSYAVELPTTVLRRSAPQPEQITRLRILNGVLEITVVQTQETDYQFERLTQDDLDHIVVHPRRSGWEIVSEAQPAEETQNDYRFVVTVPGNGRTTLEVLEERVRSSTLALTSIRDDQIIFYTGQRVIDDETAAALERIRELRAAIVAAEASRREIEQQLSTLYREQDRIRSNLGVVDPESALYDRYIASLTEQEDRIERLQTDLIRAREEEELARSALRDFIDSL